MDASTARGAVAEVMTTRGAVRRAIVAAVAEACPHLSIEHTGETPTRCAEVRAVGADGAVVLRVSYDLSTRTALVSGPLSARLVVDRDRSGLAELVRDVLFQVCHFGTQHKEGA